MKSDYEELQKHGIEIVGINVDQAKSVWQKSSSKDEIPWQNLYVDRVSDIQTKYRIKGFPTKIIFDENLNYIELDFKNAQDSGMRKE